MADLTTTRRKRLRDTDFAIPSKRKYPIHDREHAANALARVSQVGTRSEQETVRRAVCRRYPDFPTCKRKKG